LTSRQHDDRHAALLSVFAWRNKDRTPPVRQVLASRVFRHSSEMEVVSFERVYKRRAFRHFLVVGKTLSQLSAQRFDSTGKNRNVSVISAVAVIPADGHALRRKFVRTFFYCLEYTSKITGAGNSCIGIVLPGSGIVKIEIYIVLSKFSIELVFRVLKLHRAGRWNKCVYFFNLLWSFWRSGLTGFFSRRSLWCF